MVSRLRAQPTGPDTPADFIRYHAGDSLGPAGDDPAVT